MTAGADGSYMISMRELLPDKTDRADNPGTAYRRQEDARMSQKKTGTGSGGQDDFIAELQRSREQREKTYREQALKLFPWVCARCGRELSGKKLRELTVHHKDHNHDNNPPDGSNWELLCVYCHDNEHSKDVDSQWYGEDTKEQEQEAAHTYKAFAGLGALLKDKKGR